MNIKRLEKLKDNLRRRLYDIVQKIDKIKRFEKQKNLQRDRDRRYIIVARVFNGETVSGVARSLGVTPPSVLMKIQKVCRFSNSEVYEKGIRHTETNNYMTPPLKYLIENKNKFGF